MTEKQAEKEAKRQAVLFEEKCKTGQFLSSSIKFIDFSNHWITEYAQKQLKAKTVSRYKDLLKRINHAFGHMKLDKIQPIHLMRFYNNSAEEGIRANISYIPIPQFIKAIDTISITKTAFAQKSGISYTTLRQACLGKKVAAGTACQLSKALQQNMHKLFQEDSEKTTLSPKTIQHYHRLLSSLFQTAVQWQILLSTPCERVKPPKVKPKESRYLNDTEVFQLLDYLNDEDIQHQAIIILLLYTGMRRGELCGLKWSDIDFDTQTISIQRTVLYLPEKGLFEDSTKTSHSKRILKVSNNALQLLTKYKIAQNQERLKSGDQWNHSNYVFTQWNGKPIHPDSVTAWFKNFIKRHSLPNVSIHSLRHTNASLLITNGINITTVSKRLGHSNIAITASIYAHAIQSAEEAAADTL